MSANQVAVSQTVSSSWSMGSLLVFLNGWSVRSHETSRSGWQRVVTSHPDQSSLLLSESEICLWSAQGNQTSSCCSSWNSSGLNSSPTHALDHPACSPHDHPVPHSSGWRNNIGASFQQGSSGSLIQSLGNEFWVMFSHSQLLKSFISALNLRSMILFGSASVSLYMLTQVRS